MADITACFGHGCVSRDTCYRFTCVKSEWQSYADFDLTRGIIPSNNEANCSYYWRQVDNEKKIAGNKTKLFRGAIDIP